MQQIGKSEIIANIYFIASNRFIVECVDGENESGEIESEQDVNTEEKT